MLEGEISEIQLVERLVELWREPFTGAIRFESDGIIKIVYFKGGDILSASTNDRADSVDEILMRAGKVSREHVKQALAKRKENETLGDALLNLGFITRKELTWARRVQVVGVIRSIAAWTSGSFTIVADYLPKRDEGTLFPLPQVLTELIVTDQDRQKSERAMDAGAAVFAKSADFDDVFRSLGLNEQAEVIIRQIDGKRSVAEVATTSGGETFNVYKLVQALATLGILKRAGRPEAEPEFSLDEFAAAGVADAADVWNEAPQPQPTPAFEMEEAPQPTLEIQVPPEPPRVTSTSAWDEEAEPQPESDTPMATEKIPAWDLPPRESAPMPLPISVEPAVEAEKERWGFDEAQIETARASMGEPARAAAKRKPGGRYGLIVALLVILILAGAGYAMFMWWQGREEGDRGSLLVTRAARPALTAAPTPATTTTAETIQAPPSLPPPAPTAVDTAAALPKMTPKPMVIAAAAPAAGRERYDAMARVYAANPTGNFTVQIQILCDSSNLQKAMNAGGDRVWFVPQPIGDRACYRVFWGRYNTRDEAQRALAEVPGDLRDRSSAVKAVPRG